MIERKFISQRIKEFEIQEFIASQLKNVGFSHIKLLKTPLGEKIIIFASRPGLIVGRKGENIQRLTSTLKIRFDLENPQIEISEIGNINNDPVIVAERIATTLERFGTAKFKGVGHKMMSDVLSSGALGVEILISGKVPSTRAKRWRFYQGYLKKCGDIAVSGVKVAYASAQIKTGTVGIQVRIMPCDLKLPDRMKVLDNVVTEQSSENLTDEELDKDIKQASDTGASAEEKKDSKQKKPRKKSSDKKPKEDAEEKSEQ